MEQTANQPSAAEAHAEYVAGIGWMACTKNGRFGNYETEREALDAALAKARAA